VTFDGVNDYIEITNSLSTFDFEKTEPFSYSTWYKTNSQTAPDSFFGNLQSGSGPGVVLGFGVIGGGGCPATFATLGFIVIGAGPTFLFGCTADTPAYVTPGWHHVVLTYDGTHTVEGTKIYVDGQLQSFTANSGNFHLQGSSVSNAPMVVGDDRTGDPFDGSFDDTRFYTRVLSETNVRELYTGVSIPELTTSQVSSFSTSTATLPGEITATGAVSPTVRGFVYGLTTAYGATTTEAGTFSTGAFMGLVNGLTPGATYHFRAYASSTEGIGYSDDRTFTLETISLPTVTQSAAGSITGSSAQLAGSITHTGSTTVTARGFVYGLTNIYTATSSTLGSFSGGDFSTVLTDLNCGTTYHSASFAQNEVGIAYSDEVTFTTSVCPRPSSGSASRRQASPRPSVQTPSQVVMPQVPVVTVVTPISMNSFSRHLSLGARGSDVKTLQTFLNSQGFVISATGAGSPGSETEFFGEKTRAALIQYQKSKGIYPAIGYFGDLTKAKVLGN
jgi:hypothetical protein